MKKKQHLGHTRFFLAFVAIAFVIGVTLCTISIMRQISLPNRSSDFCTEGDPIYQRILEQLEIWDDVFPNSYQGIDSNLVSIFDVEGQNRRYTANSNFDTDNNELVVFVSTKSGWPNTRQGARGYLYIPSGLPPSGDWNTRFDTNLLSNLIYCYTT